VGLVVWTTLIVGGVAIGTDWLGAAAFPRGETLWGTLGWVLSAVVAVFMVKRLVLWMVYRPLAPHEDDAVLPTLTVVIPAFNEGPMVRRSIESVLASDYPAERLTIIVVNDGSTDDTGAHIDAVVAEHQATGRLSAIHLPQNAGKRGALYAGFKAAQTEVVATVDSDTLVRPRALRALVTPFVHRPHVAGVAGRVLVHNRFDNVLTRMLGVRYILGFDFIRAYQSVLGTVWCCPGALQAYRRPVIAPHLDAWMGQHFLGAQCTNGDDHAMTNLVLSLGYDTNYQQNAEVETLAPSTYVKLCKMYVRWARSATREGLRALAFTPRRCLRLGPWRGPLVLIDALLQPAAIVARIGALVGVLTLLFTNPLSLLNVLVGVASSAVLYGFIYLRSEFSIEAVFGVLYALFAVIFLPWIQPFATLTVRRNGWLTRG